MMNNQERFDKLNQMIEDGLIIRKKWTNKDDQGRERACLLVALSPEVAREKNPDFCPAFLMPAWLAHLTVWMDDSVSNAYWSEMVKEYAWMITKIHLLSDEKMNQLNYECRLIAVEEARSHVSENKHEILKAIDNVISLLRKASKGEEISKEKWELASNMVCNVPQEAVQEPTRWTTKFAKITVVKAAAETAKANVANVVSFAMITENWRSTTSRTQAADRIVKKILSSLRREIELHFSCSECNGFFAEDSYEDIRVTKDNPISNTKCVRFIE